MSIRIEDLAKTDFRSLKPMGLTHYRLAKKPWSAHLEAKAS